MSVYGLGLKVVESTERKAAEQEQVQVEMSPEQV